MIVPATREALVHVFGHLRAPDQAELETAAGGPLGAAELADAVLAYMGYACACVAPDGEPVAVAGVHVVGPGEGVAWAVGTDRMRERWIEIHRATRRAVRRATEDGITLRAHSWPDHPDGARWLERLGFERRGQAPLLPGGPAFDLYWRAAA